jgi:hypothetical protein
VNCICFLCAPIPLHLVAFRAAASRAREPPLFRRFNAAYCRATVVSCIPSVSVSFLLSVVHCSPISVGAPFIRPSRIHDVTITSYQPRTNRSPTSKGYVRDSLLSPITLSADLRVEESDRAISRRARSLSRLTLGNSFFKQTANPNGDVM